MSTEYVHGGFYRSGSLFSRQVRRAVDGKWFRTDFFIYERDDGRDAYIFSAKSGRTSCSFQLFRKLVGNSLSCADDESVRYVREVF